MESTLKSLRDGESVLDLSPRSTVSGGVEDVYGEDRATEDQLVTPWTFSVARYILFHHHHHVHSRSMDYERRHDRDTHTLILMMSKNIGH